MTTGSDWLRPDRRSVAALRPMKGTEMIEMIRLTAKTATPTHMSLTAVSTGAGTGGRSGPDGRPLDG